jgi:nitrate reductase gamma subunit
MKALHIIVWVSGVIAGILMLLGLIALVFNKPFFPTVNIVKYFHVANSFLLLSICCLLYNKPGAKE